MLKASIIGNLGNDPEVRYSATGAPFLRMNIASNGRRKTEAGEWVDETTWVRVTVTGQRAESLGQYLKKGSRVYVDGRLEARPWTDSRGEIKAGLEVMPDSVEFMSSRGQEDQQPTRQPVSASATPGNALEERNGGLEDLPF
jgi:single-strand DNA-binding protein